MGALRSAGMGIVFIIIGISTGAAVILTLGSSNISGDLRENILIVTVHGTIALLFTLYYYHQHKGEWD